ncbi:hypothetical protein F511_20389 [Dorcoceras hygrometricum]|uniref:Uncharacterized protein n=1 Tax=Dorcoceras hygrometricum TaxID=472368 RepID=A0A2Z7ANM9_9LAMI|nr:hypothetical protein F511_20389 [Dorcoceras hygrometricum]
MNFVKASVIHDTCESIRHDDQISRQLNQKGKAGIGYVRPENSKSSWMKNRLDKEKAKTGSKSFVQNQQRRGSEKVKSEWRKIQPRRDLNGQNSKPKLNISHHITAHTLMDFHTGKTVKEMTPSAPRTRAAAALRMKQIALDNQSRTIRRLRSQLATERRGLATMKKELEDTQVAVRASHKVIAGLSEISLSMSKKMEKMKAKKQQAKTSHVVCHQKLQARIQEAKDSMQAQHLIIEALVEEKDSLLQTIQDLQEANDAPAPFDDEWEEEPEEHPDEGEIEDIPLGEGEIDDE